MRVLVLFDVDGTLVDCSGQSREPFTRALESVHGVRPEPDGYDFSGKTDGRIAFDLAVLAGVPPAAARAGVPAVRERYLELLPGALSPAGTRILPGAVELLEALAASSEARVGLLTGNWRAGAQSKLRTAGIEREFAVGAFGEDGFDREELPPVALERARRQWNRDWSAEEVWIVGDSLLDVACARAHGLRCLAVATGRTPIAELRAAGADRVVASLEEEGVRQELLGI